MIPNLGRHSRNLGMVIAGAAITLTSAVAHADVPSTGPDNRARAQQLFDSALVDAEAGNFAAACPKFLASQEADPKTSTLLNLANCYEKNGQTASAWGAFREAEIASRNAGRADWESRARSRAVALEQKLLRLTVQVDRPGTIADLTIRRDGLKLTEGEWNVAIPVDPGAHELVASAPGFIPFRTQLTVDKSVTIKIPPLTREPAAEAPRNATESSGRLERGFWTPLRRTGAIVAGVGAAAAVTGAVLGVVAKQNYDAARERCADGARACPSDAVSSSNDAYDLATAATITGLAGLGVALTGGAIILLSPDKSSSAAAWTVGPATVRFNTSF